MNTPQQKSRNLQTKDRAEQKKRARSRFRLRTSPMFKMLAILGPGLIAANAGNDAGGIATFSTSGATYQYDLLWALVLAGFCLAVVQEMCTRMGAFTGKGLADLIREQFGVRWTAVAMLALLIANTGVTVTEFIGIRMSVQALAGTENTPFVYIIVPLTGIALWWLVIKGSYRRVEIIFLVMSLGFLAYVPAAFISDPNWGVVAQRTIAPHMQASIGYLAAAVALLGTTISPYMQFFVQSSVADKGISPSEYVYEKIETYSGTFFAILVAIFVIVTTGTLLFPKGIQVDSALTASLALQSVAGPLVGRFLFGFGLFGASLLAGAVLPLSTAYGICEAFGFERGVSRSFKEAPVFQSIFTGLIILGVAIALLPNLPIIQVLLNLQILNAIMLPVILLFIILLINNRRLMGRRVNGVVSNIVAWGTLVIVTGAVILYLGSQVLQAVTGIH